VKQLFTPKALNSVAQGKVSEANDALGTVTRRYECQQRKLGPTWNRLKHAWMRVWGDSRLARVCAVGIGRVVAFIPRAALRLPWATLFNAFGVKLQKVHLFWTW